MAAEASTVAARHRAAACNMAAAPVATRRCTPIPVARAAARRTAAANHRAQDRDQTHHHNPAPARTPDLDLDLDLDLGRTLRHHRRGLDRGRDRIPRRHRLRPHHPRRPIGAGAAAGMTRSRRRSRSVCRPPSSARQ